MPRPRLTVRGLNSPLQALDRWLLAPAPPERLAGFRILVGLYAATWSAIRLPAHLAHAGQAPSRWDPVGALAMFADPLPAWLTVTLAVTTPLLGLAFAAGWKFRLVGPLCSLALLGTTTLGSSWGLILHTENLLVLHVLLVAAAPGAADAWVWPRRQGARPDVEDAEQRRAASGRYGWPLRLAVVVVLLAYILAGLAKLEGAGIGWGSGDTLRNLVAYDNLRKSVLGDAFSPVGAALVGQGWLFTPMAVLTLVVELGAIVVLLGRRWRSLWVAAAWVFHLGVLAVMAILFPYQLSGVAFAPMFRVERFPPLRWVAQRWLEPG